MQDIPKLTMIQKPELVRHYKQKLQCIIYINVLCFNVSLYYKGGAIVSMFTSSAVRAWVAQ
jgi:hypothetical protein